MKKLIIISAAAVFLFILSAQTSQAKTYLNPYTFEDGYAAGNCIMVDNPAEADSTHVYTMNPDNTIAINQSYLARWSRNARCDEIQFHVDHNTPITRLNSWLDEVAFGWYADIGNTHFKNQTVSTSRHEWFFVDQNGIHRIPDWLTGLSWGLLIGDRMSISVAHTDNFYDLVTIVSALNFNDGLYNTKIYSIWKEKDRDFSTLPSSLTEELYLSSNPRCGSLFDPCVIIFENCQYQSSYSGDPYYNLLDWTWMLHNPGCPLAD